MIVTTRAKIAASSFVLILMLAPCAAQEVKRPPLSVPVTAASPSLLVPEGWRLETGTLLEADLNNDDRADAAFVISHGGPDSAGAQDAVVKHVLVLALRGTDGKLHRSMVNDAAVLDGDEGGAFGDPFQELSSEVGAIAITHYGGSRGRWGFKHWYLLRNGRWLLVGLELGNTDSLDLEHYDNQDIDITTGLVKASEKGGYEGEPKKPETSGSYYELEVWPVDTPPQIDGRIDNNNTATQINEWHGHWVALREQEQVVRNRKSWSADDLSATIHAMRRGDDLFLGVEVFDNKFTRGDTVRLVNRRGLAIKPIERKLSPTRSGYVFEARFSLRAIARASQADDKYIVENLEMALEPAGPYGDFQGFAMPVSLEIVDVDRAARRGGVLSTRLAGSPYTGSIRIFRPGTLELISDVKD